ncbi:MAG: hypothetical protein JWR75_1541 [Devosia sp.]|nr:hypothetical protein [Devosia sp.]
MYGDELNALLADRTVNTPTGRIVRMLSEHGAQSATQIAKLTGLAKSTVSTALSELRKSGMVVEAVAENGREAGVGRPSTRLTLNPEAGTCVGILIGLNHIQVIVADVSHAVLADKTAYVTADYTPAEGVQIARRLVNEAYLEHGLSSESLIGVGIAAAGPVDPRSGRMLRASGIPTWAGIEIPKLFEPVFRRPIFVDNESNCSALAEMMWGDAVGREDFVLFTLDIGVGGAIVSGGRLVRGVAGAGAEFGHIGIDPNGPLCRCGNRGCLELYASFETPLVHASRRFGRSMTVDEVIRLALAGDSGCRRLIEDTADVAGRGLGIIGSTINPPLVLISGVLARAGELMLKPLRASFDRHTLVKRDDVPAESRTEIRISRFLENGPCLGAVGLVLRHQGRLL